MRKRENESASEGLSPGTGLEQNASFIRNTYRKAVITGILAVMSVNINVFVDGILVGTRLGPEALAAINLSLPVYLAMCVLGSFLAAGTEIPAARAMGTGDTGSRDLYFRTGLNVSVLASVVVTVLALLLRQQTEGGDRPVSERYAVISGAALRLLRDSPLHQ